MTIKELKEIIQTIADEAIVLISTEDVYEVETVAIEYHSDGKQHFIISNLE